MKLFIIGNGFDLNHGYNTSYKNFKNYIYSNSYEIGSFSLKDYFPDDDDLWSDFENNLEFIDFKESTDFFLGDLTPEMSDKEWERECSRRSALQDSFEEAPEKLYPALCTALSDFICKETSSKVSAQSKFSSIMTKNDIYITFNYSKTLENLYNIPETNINHIHGIAYPSFPPDYDDIDITYEDPSIIFGHGDLHKIKHTAEESNPMNPNGCLNDLNTTMKKVYQIKSFIDFIKNYAFDSIEIIGHDFGKVDLPYFKALNKILNTSEVINYWLFDMSKHNEKKKDLQRVFSKNRINIHSF
ncbi:MAG: bacteriophage abortive infection AbiH family protein [Treponema sp.]|uniref:bacteriophage abortive infection AbiH family protein n=1 Tax=Treponema sp. TaxID=166 RepID=UPI0025ECF1C0|nr:bacteriophage abortive infection AbiH family protein [Treponema sp.]MBQ8680684.1 bacteriophage abortive infection AbiH family protein [Treponema sp.]